ncbi:MAG: endonuclease/exonuclease/phosphatase family protein [Verrucomicrobiales bacterium]
MLPRLPSSLAAALLLALAQPAAAVEIRVATLNVELGVGQPGTLEFNAVSQVLKRLDADVVALQEVRRADTDGSPSSLDALASGAGYAHRFAPGFLPLDSNTRTILLSKFPLAETAAVGPPPGANDMARAHAAARVDVPGTASDPLVIGVHLKCCADPDDPFRRAVEIAHLRGFLAAQAGAGDRVIALGDFNLLGEAETFDALPRGCRNPTTSLRPSPSRSPTRRTPALLRRRRAAAHPAAQSRAGRQHRHACARRDARPHPRFDHADRPRARR